MSGEERGGVPTELKTKRTELFEGNTLVRSVMHALTRLRRQLGRKERRGRRRSVANFMRTCEASTYEAAK